MRVEAYLTTNISNEVLFILLMLIAFIFALISLLGKDKFKYHSLKVVGIFIVTAISIYINIKEVYWLSIITLAATFNSTRFLERIVAIVFKNQDYVKESTALEKEENLLKHSSEKEVRREKEDEMIKEEIGVDKAEIDKIRKLYKSNNEKINPNQLQMLETFKTYENEIKRSAQTELQISDKIIELYEQKYNSNIRREVRVGNTTFDGLIKTGSLSRSFLEIKVVSSSYINPVFFEKILSKSIQSVKTYSEHSSINANLIIIIACHSKYIQKIRNQFYTYIRRIIPESIHNDFLELKIFSFEELEVELTEEGDL